MGLSQPIGFGSLSCSPCCSESSLCRRRSLTQIPTRLMIFSSHLGLIRRVLLSFSPFAPFPLFSTHSVLFFFSFNLFLIPLSLLISRRSFAFPFTPPPFLPFTVSPINGWPLRVFTLYAHYPCKCFFFFFCEPYVITVSVLQFL